MLGLSFLRLSALEVRSIGYLLESNPTEAPAPWPDASVGDS